VGGRRKSCRGERKAGRRRERAAVAAWWVCWLAMVEMVVALAGGWNDGEREGRRNVLQRRDRRLRCLITDVVVAGRWSWQRLVVLVAQGGAGGRNGDGVGFLWRRKKKEVEEENLQRGEGGRLVFWLTLDPIFSSLKSLMEPLFIGSRRG